MSEPRETLLLWDIDGTLVDTDHAGERALLAAMKEIYGLGLDRLPVDLRGRTDTSIFRELLEWLEVAAGHAEALHFQQTYLTQLKKFLPLGKARLHPGILAALEGVRDHTGLHQALLTGNLQEGARLKLSHLGIWNYFEFGAFADDSSNRDELGPFALVRAKEKLGVVFPPERVFVIGDTPRDIACGKAFGAKTVAVATGTFTEMELAAHQPTHVLSDLGDTAAFIALVS